MTRPITASLVATALIATALGLAACGQQDAKPAASGPFHLRSHGV